MFALSPVELGQCSCLGMIPCKIGIKQNQTHRCRKMILIMGAHQNI